MDAKNREKPRPRRSSLKAKEVERQFERFEEAWFNFHRYDADGSGTIDKQELVRYYPRA